MFVDIFKQISHPAHKAQANLKEPRGIFLVTCYTASVGYVTLRYTGTRPLFAFSFGWQITHSSVSQPAQTGTDGMAFPSLETGLPLVCMQTESTLNTFLYQLVLMFKIPYSCTGISANRFRTVPALSHPEVPL